MIRIGFRKHNKWNWTEVIIIDPRFFGGAETMIGVIRPVDPMQPGGEHELELADKTYNHRLGSAELRIIADEIDRIEKGISG